MSSTCAVQERQSEASALYPSPPPRPTAQKMQLPPDPAASLVNPTLEVPQLGRPLQDASWVVTGVRREAAKRPSPITSSNGQSLPPPGTTPARKTSPLRANPLWVMPGPSACDFPATVRHTVLSDCRGRDGIRPRPPPGCPRLLGCTTLVNSVGCPPSPVPRRAKLQLERDRERSSSPSPPKRRTDQMWARSPLRDRPSAKGLKGQREPSSPSMSPPRGRSRRKEASTVPCPSATKLRARPPMLERLMSLSGRRPQSRLVTSLSVSPCPSPSVWPSPASACVMREKGACPIKQLLVEDTEDMDDEEELETEGSEVAEEEDESPCRFCCCPQSTSSRKPKNLQGGGRQRETERRVWEHDIGLRSQSSTFRERGGRERQGCRLIKKEQPTTKSKSRDLLQGWAGPASQQEWRAKAERHLDVLIGALVGNRGEGQPAERWETGESEVPVDRQGQKARRESRRTDLTDFGYDDEEEEEEGTPRGCHRASMSPGRPPRDGARRSTSKGRGSRSSKVCTASGRQGSRVSETRHKSVSRHSVATSARSRSVGPVGRRSHLAAEGETPLPETALVTQQQVAQENTKNEPEETIAEERKPRRGVRLSEYESNSPSDKEAARRGEGGSPPASPSLQKRTSAFDGLERGGKGEGSSASLQTQERKGSRTQPAAPQETTQHSSARETGRSLRGVVGKFRTTERMAVNRSQGREREFARPASGWEALSGGSAVGGVISGPRGSVSLGLSPSPAVPSRSQWYASIQARLEEGERQIGCFAPPLRIRTADEASPSASASASASAALPPRVAAETQTVTERCRHLVPGITADGGLHSVGDLYSPLHLSPRSQQAVARLEEGERQIGCFAPPLRIRTADEASPSASASASASAALPPRVAAETQTVTERCRHLVPGITADGGLHSVGDLYSPLHLSPRRSQCTQHSLMIVHDDPTGLGVTSSTPFYASGHDCGAFVAEREMSAGRVRSGRNCPCPGPALVVCSPKRTKELQWSAKARNQGGLVAWDRRHCPPPAPWRCWSPSSPSGRPVSAQEGHMVRGGGGPSSSSRGPLQEGNRNLFQDSQPAVGFQDFARRPHSYRSSSQSRCRRSRSRPPFAVCSSEGALPPSSVQESVRLVSINLNAFSEQCSQRQAAREQAWGDASKMEEEVRAALAQRSRERRPEKNVQPWHKQPSHSRRLRAAPNQSQSQTQSTGRVQSPKTQTKTEQQQPSPPPQRSEEKAKTDGPAKEYSQAGEPPFEPKQQKQPDRKMSRAADGGPVVSEGRQV
uniref:Uncharacterized protein n=1 Tax=Chromera velia CCMP2878 TaxID=1169474 RepID=A0A0K6SB68_9ALVE|eukprot:Cvel_13357.t2-p1 / transcript=Cvel_13357.t2 / gene=Cvel_13357 / organism=Chromera_velia_CCMP2878 / gene_product=hypothetical protein / transcript_product=hypothetical protein / location=Cvel_scaffold907:44384-55455(+) / protein_length=1267 / sequence_SO=supercontig / SO=protein_coding / is_pseudo=false